MFDLWILWCDGSLGQDISCHWREKLNALCDTKASQSNQNLSVWEHKIVNLLKNLLVVLDVLELVVSTQDIKSIIVDHIHMKYIHIYCIENVITYTN